MQNPTQFADERALRSSLAKEGSPPPAPPLAIAVPRVRVERATALHAFTATGDGELSIQRDQRVVLDGPEDQDGWVEVHIEDDSRRRGVVPMSYLRIEY